MKHTKNIKVKTGEFVDRATGKTKGRYITVGKVLTDDKGKELVLLDRTFNPAGVPTDKESIILNFWDTEEKRDIPEDAKEGLNKLYDSSSEEIPF